MRAIPPNRYSLRNRVRARGCSTLFARGMRIVGAVVLVFVASQRGWSDDNVAEWRSSTTTSSADKSAPTKPKAPASTLRIAVAPDRTERSLVTRANEIPAVVPVIPAPTFVVPLSIGDYENYIQRDVTGEQLKALRATLPIASQIDIAAAAEAAQSSIAPPVDDLIRLKAKPAIAAPPAQDRPTSIATSIRKPGDEASALYESKIADATPTAKEFSSADKVNQDSSGSSSQSQLRVAKVSEAMVNQSRDTEQSVTRLAQVPEPPKSLPAPIEPKVKDAPVPMEPKAPVEPKVKDIAAPVATLPIEVANTATSPLTTSSYLPANPENYCFRCGVKCPPCGCNPGGPGWAATQPIPWEVFAQGEYVGPARLAHVPIYRLRVDDQLAFVYRLSGQVSGQPYRLNVRDRVLVQSLTVPDVVNREVLIQPDGTITLPLLGQIRAAGSTIEELGKSLDEQFKKADITDPRITVTPVEMNSNLQELRSSVDRRYGQGGQVSDARISPDGTVQLPAIGSVPAQGLTLEELEREVKARYAQIVEGLEITPILTARAPRYVFVVGEVKVPGRYAMEGPTTLMQAISLAGSWNVGAGLNQVVVFRRDENWQLMATMVNIRESLLFKKPCPSGEIWLRDSDVVLIPKSPILCADDVISLIFTRGIYGVFPMNATLNFVKSSTL